MPGIIAMPQPIPLGYYKDAKKTAETFKTIDGVRYSMPGDWCVVEKDGTLTLLGRGSVCINTAGEKVYPEEVEETLKLHPAVEDALVVGVPDDKWGQAITAVVVTSGDFDEESIRAHVRERLAGYKTPKRVIVAGVYCAQRTAKADYKSALAFAKRRSWGSRNWDLPRAAKERTAEGSGGATQARSSLARSRYCHPAEYRSPECAVRGCRVWQEKRRAGCRARPRDS